MFPPRRCLALLLLPLLVGVVAVAFAQRPAPTPAGTVIRNQAAAILGGERYLSNEVETVVRALCLPDLGPDGSVAAPGQFASAGPLQRVYLPYTLTNAGNRDATFALGWALDAASAWTPGDVALHHDLDADGRLDAGEPRVDELRLPYGGSARLLLALQLPAGAEGDSWLAPLASCAGGSPDRDNYARIRAGAGPALQLAKTATPQRVAPGDRVDFELRLQNVGSRASGAPVTLSDRFDRAELAGLAYEPDSLAVSRGRAEYFDGAAWRAGPPSDAREVRGVRVTVDDLAPGEVLRAAFAMRAEPGAAPGGRRNLARAEGPGGPAQVTADLEVVTAFRHHLGPSGNPRALAGGEGSADDRQERDFLVFGQRFCFAHTLENAGNQADVYRIELAGIPDGVRATLDLREGTPLANPVELAPAETRDFSLCLTPGTAGGPFEAVLTATSQRSGARNRTVDAVGRVEAGDALRLTKRADGVGVLELGQLLTYTLEVENANPFDLTNVVIADPLLPLERLGGGAVPAGVATSFVAASDGGVYDAAARRVAWRIPRVPSGATLQRTVQLRLPESVPLGAVFTLRNRFTLQAQELPAPLPSNEVTHAFPEIALRLAKRVAPERARIGDALDYTLEIHNPNELPLRLVVDDVPPSRTRYLPGSAELTLGGVTRRVEPRVSADGLQWDLREIDAFELGPRGGARDTLVVRYRLTLLPGAEGELRNIARATGSYDSEATGVQAVASNEAEAVVTVDDALLGDPAATLLGRVFLDGDDDGRYTAGRDAPLPGARVLLANGVQAISDAEGRYAFRELRPGTHAVMLDPASAPFTPRPHPEALGDGYRHRVVAQGVTVSDFPLEPLRGRAAVDRSTTLQLGPLRVEKRHLALPGGVRVVLTLESAETLPGLRVVDPVAGGDARIFAFERFVGRTTETYDLKGDPPLTDPEVGWSYP